MRVWTGLAAMSVGAAPFSAAGCSMLLADPGGYYLADAATSSSADGYEAAPRTDAGVSADDAGADMGAPADVTPVDTGDTDADDAGGPKCHSTQIQQPANHAAVTSPVHLVTTWDPCMSAIDCYLDGNPNSPVATTMSAPGIDADIGVSPPGTHYFACTTFYQSGSATQTPPTMFTVVAGDAAAE